MPLPLPLPLPLPQWLPLPLPLPLPLLLPLSEAALQWSVHERQVRAWRWPERW